MSKIINIFNVMASVLFLSLIMACNMQVSQLLKNENLIDNNPQNQNYDSQFVKISFDLDQSIYDTRTFSKRTILPDDLDISSYTFILSGISADESFFDGSEDSDYRWTSYAAFHSASLTLKPGTWNFTLIIYDLNGNEYARAELDDVVLVAGDSSKTLTFKDFSYSESGQTCSFEISINILKGLLKNEEEAPDYTVESLTGTNENGITIVYSLSGEKTVSGKTYNTYRYTSDNPLKPGLLALTFSFDTASSYTTKRIIFVYLAWGRKSSGEIYFDDLNKEYSITFNLTSGMDSSVYNSDDFALSTSDTKYLVSEDVTLPQATYSNSSGENVTFGGWYKSSDFTDDNKIEGWEAGTMSEDLSLYARWYVPIKYLDYHKDYYSGQPYTLDSNNDELPLEYTINSTSALTIPEATSIYDKDSLYKKSGAENTVLFIDWVNQDDKSLLNGSSYILSSGQNPKSSITLQAKWGFNYVYVDPSASESGCGYIASEPTKSFSEALNILTIQDSSKENKYAKTVYVKSEIVLSEDVDDLLDSSICNYNIVIIRYRDYLNGPLFRIKGNVTFPAITIWGVNDSITLSGQEITCSGSSATAPLIRIDSGKLTLSGSGFLQKNYNSNSVKEESGGAIYLAPGAELEVSGGFYITSNGSEYGGAIMNNGGKVTLNSSFVTKNVAKFGGAIYSCEDSGDVSVINSGFSGNKAGESGGVFYIEGGSFEFDGNSILCDVYSNSAYSKAAFLYAGKDSKITLSYIRIYKNTLTSKSNTYGAGIYLDSGSSCWFKKSVFFYDNTSSGTLSGAAVYKNNSATLKIGNSTEDVLIRIDDLYIGKTETETINPITVLGLPQKSSESNVDYILKIDNSNLSDGDKILKFQDHSLSTALSIFTSVIKGYYQVKDSSTNNGHFKFDYTDSCVHAIYKEGDEVSEVSEASGVTILPGNNNYVEYDLGQLSKSYISLSSDDLTLTLKIPAATYNVISSSDKSVSAVLYGPDGTIKIAVIIANISSTEDNGYYPVVFQNLVDSSYTIGSYTLVCSAKAEDSSNVIATKSYTIAVVY